MTWTYTTQPSTVNRDAVRLLTGQTSSSDEVLLADEAITYALAQRDNVELAAAFCMDMLADRYATFPASKQVGQLGITYAKRAEQLRDGARLLRRGNALSAFTPFVGGTSVADKQAREADTDRPAPMFERGQFDNVGAGDPVSDPTT